MVAVAPASARSYRVGAREPRHLSTISTCCPIRTSETSDMTLLSHLAGSSATKQSY